MNLQELQEILEKNGVDLSLYGKGQAKSLDKLLHEINDPEEGVELCELQNTGEIEEYGARLLRRAKVFNIHVHYDNVESFLRLREALQIFNDGRFRARLERIAAISEKRHHGEGFLDGVLRSLSEELGLENVSVSKIVRMEGITSLNFSQSYPGILTEYKIYQAEYQMEDNFYKPEGYVEVQPDKKTYFVWEKV